MDAIAVEKKIRERFDDIVETIAFFYEKKHQKEIKERCKKLDFFVYDDSVLHAAKITVIDRLEVAMEFVKDISFDIDVSQDRKNEIEYLLATIIIEASKHKDKESVVRNLISKVEEVNSEKYIMETLKVIDLYKDDYQIKSMEDIIERSNKKRAMFDERLYQIKLDILKTRFSIKGNFDVKKIWNLLDAFVNDVELLQSGEFKNIVASLQKQFYLEIGCKGNTLEELENDAIDKGIFMSSIIYYDIITEYADKYNRAYRDIMSNSNNLSTITKKLNDKGYVYNENHLRLVVTNEKTQAFNFLCLDKNRKMTSFIIYPNNAEMYSNIFDATCFHEIIHYLGGQNKDECKRGLKFCNMEVYTLLEESFAHYISLKIAESYNNEHGHIMKVWYNTENNSAYNRTIEYMDKVFKLYGKELMEIHLSNSITLKDANKIIPLDDLAYSVSRIYNDSDPKVATKEELKKLNRGNKK